MRLLNAGKMFRYLFMIKRTVFNLPQIWFTWVWKRMLLSVRLQYRGLHLFSLYRKLKIITRARVSVLLTSCIAFSTRSENLKLSPRVRVSVILTSCREGHSSTKRPKWCGTCSPIWLKFYMNVDHYETWKTCEYEFLNTARFFSTAL